MQIVSTFFMRFTKWKETVTKFGILDSIKEKMIIDSLMRHMKETVSMYIRKIGIEEVITWQIADSETDSHREPYPKFVLPLLIPVRVTSAPQHDHEDYDVSYSRDGNCDVKQEHCVIERKCTYTSWMWTQSC